jgi:hypothetical protein
MRTLFFSTLLIIVSMSLSAQNRFGIKAGTSMSYIKSDLNKVLEFRNPASEDFPLGYLLGLSYQIPINSLISFQPEFNYSYQVSKGYNTKAKMTYTQVPLLFQVHPRQSRAALYLGPQLNFLNAAKVTQPTGTEVPGSSPFVQTDFGICYGVGYRPSDAGVTFDLRMFKSFTNVIKAEYDNGNRSRTLNIYFTVGYLFNK